MGLFDKVKSIINDAKDRVAQQAAQKQEEENRRREEEQRRKEEEKRREEEANRFNPDGKSFQWFSSEDGIKTFKEYITAQNFILEETIKKEHEEKYSEYDYDVFVSVVHEDAKLPSVFFDKFVNTINAQALKYVGPSNGLVDILCAQAKPFDIDNDGEPQPIEPYFTPEDLLSIEKNPVLNFVHNFDCFELKDDDKGSWGDKYLLWAQMLCWTGIFGRTDKTIISENPWIFSKEVYFNDLGTVRTLKGLYKKCMELTTNEDYQAFFENKYNEC